MNLEAVHGGDVYSRPVELDFSANLNPLGMPERVREALTRQIDGFARYPDVHHRALRHALSQREGVPPERIVCGSGAADLIYRIVRVKKPRRALVLAPTFSEYEKALAEEGCRVEYYHLTESRGFCLDEGILERLDGVDMLFLCSPNNPVGRAAEAPLLEKVAARCGETGAFLVADQCFLDFMENPAAYALAPRLPHVAVLKAFTKIYAMAGLRLGYLLLGDEALAERIHSHGPCWNVSGPALAAGLAALGEPGFVERTVALVTRERAFLEKGLAELGCKVYPSQVNFLLFSCGTPLAEPLLDRRIAVRSCANYRGLDRSFYRAAVRGREENRRLLAAMREVLENG